MNQNDRFSKEIDRYRSLRKTVIESEHLRPQKMIMPVTIILMIIAVMSIYTYIQKKIYLKLQSMYRCKWQNISPAT